MGSMCVAAAVLAVGVSAASARPGALDRSFGTAGKVTMALQLEGGSTILRAPFEMASAPGGIVIAQGRSVIRYRPNGRLDTSFGQDGQILIEEPTGSRFAFGGLAVDSLGRILIAGTTRPEPERSMPGPSWSPHLGVSPAMATVIRYLPDGTLDAEFGSGGTISTDFGLPAPNTDSESAFTYEAPAVAVTGIAVDAENRPVLTGTMVAKVSLCSHLTLPLTAAYIARLDPSGGPDPTFHGTGVAIPEGPFSASEPVVDGAGAITYAARTGSQCERGEGPPIPSLGGLERHGNPNLRLGPTGSLPLDVNRIALDRRGLILAMDRSLSSRELPAAKPAMSRTRLVRLRPDGTLDRRFGRDGTATIWLPGGQSSLRAVTVDGRGRPLVAGILAPSQRLAEGRGSKGTRKFVLIRLRKTGGLDRSFGRGGRVVTGFGGRSDARGEQVAIDDRGRAVVAGALIGPALPGGEGLALARYRLDG